MKQEMMGWQWHQRDHMQIICTSHQTDNDVTSATLHSIFTGQMPFLMPYQQCQSTEGNPQYNTNVIKTTATHLKTIKYNKTEIQNTTMEYD